MAQRDTLTALKQLGGYGIPTRAFERILLNVAGCAQSHHVKRESDHIDMISAEMLIKAGADLNRPAYSIGGFDGPIEFYVRDTYDRNKDNDQYQNLLTLEDINRKYHTIGGKLERIFHPA